MDLMYYRYFYEIAGGSSFADTSEKFSISESALSKSIIKLENELNCTLFDRRVRPMRLTASGGMLKSKLDVLMPLYEDMINSLNENKLLLRYGAMNTLYQHDLSEFFSKYMDTHKDINLSHMDVTDASPLNFLHLISNAEIEFAILHDSIFIPPHIKKSFLTRDHVKVIMLKDNPLAGYDSITTEQLIGQNVIGPGCTQDICAELAFICGKQIIAEFYREEAIRIFKKCISSNCISLYYASDIIGYNLDYYGLCARPLSDLPRSPLILVRGDNPIKNQLIDSIADDLKKYLGTLPSAGKI